MTGPATAGKPRQLIIAIASFGLTAMMILTTVQGSGGFA